MITIERAAFTAVLVARPAAGEVKMCQRRSLPPPHCLGSTQLVLPRLHRIIDRGLAWNISDRRKKVPPPAKANTLQPCQRRSLPPRAT